MPRFGGELITFLLRLALLLTTLGFAYWLLIRLRGSGSRYLPVAFALVGFRPSLALVMAGDYVGHHIDVEQLGPLVLSIAGIALTLGAFWWLQRYLARRIPQRRVRKNECPFCGYPARGSEHCEGCGRSGDRRVHDLSRAASRGRVPLRRVRSGLER